MTSLHSLPWPSAEAGAREPFTKERKSKVSAHELSWRSGSASIPPLALFFFPYGTRAAADPF